MVESFLGAFLDKQIKNSCYLVMTARFLLKIEQNKKDFIPV